MAEGFIYVPDSLTTGVYFLSAFFYGQSTMAWEIIHQKSLFVYNRFQKDIEAIAVPVQKTEDYRKTEPLIKIIPEKRRYAARSKVVADIDFREVDSIHIQQVVIKAVLADSLAEIYGGNFWGRSKPAILQYLYLMKRMGWLFRAVCSLKTQNSLRVKRLCFFRSLTIQCILITVCLTAKDIFRFLSKMHRDQEKLF
jgi:hypothetical protein